MAKKLRVRNGPLSLAREVVEDFWMGATKFCQLKERGTKNDAHFREGLRKEHAINSLFF